MLVSIPPKISVASFMGYLKGKSSVMIFEKHANMRYKYGNRKFWCRGYYIDTVGKNEKAIREYIANQLRQDKEYEQISIVHRPVHGRAGKITQEVSHFSGGVKTNAAGGSSSSPLGLARNMQQGCMSKRPAQLVILINRQCLKSSRF